MAFAKVNWSKKNERYELIIDGTLKAYATYSNDKELEKGKEQLVDLAERKGYNVHINHKE